MNVKHYVALKTLHDRHAGLHHTANLKGFQTLECPWLATSICPDRYDQRHVELVWVLLHLVTANKWKQPREHCVLCNHFISVHLKLCSMNKSWLHSDEDASCQHRSHVPQQLHLRRQFCSLTTKRHYLSTTFNITHTTVWSLVCGQPYIHVQRTPNRDRHVSSFIQGILTTSSSLILSSRLSGFLPYFGWHFPIL